jgi:hypothetical protein
MNLQEAFDAGFEAVKTYVERSFDAYEVRMSALEKRIDRLPAPKDGKDADPHQIVSTVTVKLDADLSTIRKALDELDKRVPNDIKSMVDDAVSKAVAALPAPADLSEDLAAVRAAVEAIEIPEVPHLEMPDIAGLVDKAVKSAVAALPAPADLSEDLAAVKAAVEAIEIPEIPHLELPDIAGLVDDAVNSAVAAIPAPQDGKSVTVEDVAPLISVEVEKRVATLPKAKDGDPGRDGVGLAGAFIDRDGNLIITMTNGEPRNLGCVVGKDGEPGAPGRDGFNLEDFDAKVMDDRRTVLLSFTGKTLDYKVELGFPVMIYRGVFKDGQKYERGDTVTWGGSLWHCDSDTQEKPGEGSTTWTLCAKKGRDGKDGELKEVKAHQPVRVGVPGKVV